MIRIDIRALRGPVLRQPHIHSSLACCRGGLRLAFVQKHSIPESQIPSPRPSQKTDSDPNGREPQAFIPTPSHNPSSSNGSPSNSQGSLPEILPMSFDPSSRPSQLKGLQGSGLRVWMMSTFKHTQG